MLSHADIDKKRKAKEENRRKVKEQRKNRVKESILTKKPATLDKEAAIMKQVEKVQAELDKETFDAETLHKLTFAEKSTMITKLTNEIIEASERRYRKINDLILFTEDPRDVDIV